MPTTEPTQTWDIPMLSTHRLGQVLRSARESLGFSIEQLAERSSGRFAPHDLTQAESGDVGPDQEAIAELARLYRLSDSGSLPERCRLVIDLSGGSIATGTFITALPEHSVRNGLDREAILERYLAAVYRMRGTTPGRRIRLRSDDLVVLADAFQTDVITITRQLHQLMMDAESHVEAKLAALNDAALSDATMIPAAGLSIGETTIGALLFIAPDEDDQTAMSAVEANVASDVAGQVDRLDDRLLAAMAGALESSRM